MIRHDVTLSWPLDLAGEAVAALARESGLRSTLASGGETVRRPPLAGQWERALESSADGLGLESQAVSTTDSDLAVLLRSAPPAILQVATSAGPRLLAVVAGRRRVRVIGPDLRIRHIEAEAVGRAVRLRDDDPHAVLVDRLLDIGQIPSRRRARCRERIDQELWTEAPTLAWILRERSDGPISNEIRWARLPARLVTLLGLHTLYVGLWLASWWLFARRVMEGGLESSWLAGWALLLMTMLPVRLAASMTAGRLSIDTAAMLKRRLLAGALRLDDDAVRSSGAGMLMGRVIEAEELETLGLTGGIVALTALVELVAAAWVLSRGAAAGLHLALLVTWVFITAALAARYYDRRKRWTAQRVRMTSGLLEQLIAHRTRLAQRGIDHSDEDAALDAYLRESRALDEAAVRLGAFIPRGWMLAGLIALAPAFASADTSVARMAVAVAGVLLGTLAFRGLASGLEQLATAAIAWRSGADVLATRPPRDLASPVDGAAAPLAPSTTVDDTRVLLDVRNISVRYPGRATSAIREVSLRVFAGDRILLQGPSGSGKSTLAAVLAGLRHPDAGLVLLQGLDRGTLGVAGWRRGVALTPQFHDNHVLMGSFAYNLLVGRRWPATREDRLDAWAVCQALGLASLVGRMPGGLDQMVGDTGWQLSHGERTRLFVARALLQQADVLLFDENFGSLDPDTLLTTLKAVLDRAPTLLVIAHP